MAKQVFERVGRALGIAIACMVNSLNLPLYVIGGGVSSAWNAFCRQCSTRCDNAFGLCRDTPRGTAQESAETAHNPDHAGAMLGGDGGSVRRGTSSDDAGGRHEQSMAQWFAL